MLTLVSPGKSMSVKSITFREKMRRMIGCGESALFFPQTSSATVVWILGAKQGSQALSVRCTVDVTFFT